MAAALNPSPDKPEFVNAMAFLAPFTLTIDEFMGVENDYVSDFPIRTINFITPQGAAPRRRSSRAIGAPTGGAAAADANGTVATTTSSHEDEANSTIYNICYRRCY